MSEPIRVLSFGAGVQSSYVARASLLGELPPFDHVVLWLRLALIGAVRP